MRPALVSLSGRSSRDCFSPPHSCTYSRASFLVTSKTILPRTALATGRCHHVRLSSCSPVRRLNSDSSRVPRCRYAFIRNLVPSTTTSAQVVQEEEQAKDVQQEWQEASPRDEDGGSEQLQSEDGWETGLNAVGHSSSTLDQHALPAPSRSSSKSKPLSREEMVEKIGAHVFDAPIPSSVFDPMINTIRTARDQGLPDKGPGHVADTLWEAASPQRRLSTNFMQRQSPVMVQDLMKKRKNPRWQAHLRNRMRLPVMADGLHKKLNKVLEECDVLIVPGSTGSGKSTQVPQIILDYAVHEGKGGYTNIICAQPRRISAVSVARRVAEERCEAVGHTVGYHVRFSDTLPKKYGSILYCTGGILWNYLHHRPNDLMDNTSHILVDEVHERSIEIDLILMILRKLIHERRANGLRYPKLLLMSATLKSEDFVKYFSDPLDSKCGLRTASFEVPGRLFPIKEIYLDTLLPNLSAQQVPAIKSYMESQETKTYVQQEIHSPGPATEEQMTRDYFVPPGLVAAATMQIFSTTNAGDVLVFLPGMSDIEKTASLLEQHRAFLENTGCAGVKIFKLHSQLSETNDQVFDEIPEGWRRIVLASNIAETSVTLPGVAHVIDTGTMKLATQDAVNELRELRCRWASRQSVHQRRGRAGRMGPGNYYALYSRARLEMFDENVMPEIQRVELTGAALSLKTMAKPLDIKSGLCHVPDQPVEEEILAAVKRLQRLGALTDSEEVTPLGRALSKFAVSPAGAKALLLGVLFRCLEPMLIAAVTDAEPLDQRVTDGMSLLKSRYLFSQGSGSNSIASYNAFKELRQAITSGDWERESQLASERGLRREMYHYIGKSARQICEQLHDSGFANMPALGGEVYPEIPPELNTYANCQPLIKILLMLSTEPEMAVRWSKHTFFSGQGLMMPAFRSVNDHVSSFVHREQIGTRIPERGDLITYAHGRTTTDSQRLVMVQTSTITPLVAILFARTAEKLGATHVKLNGAINLNVAAMNDSPTLPLSEAVKLTLEFRKMLDRLLQLAFSDLHPGDRHREKPADCNKLFAAEHKLRDKLTEGLVEVLNQDAMAESTMLEQRYVIWEEREDLRLKHQAEQRSANQRVKLGLNVLNKEARTADGHVFANSQQDRDRVLRMV